MDLMVLSILYPILKIHLFLKAHGLNRGLCVGPKLYLINAYSLFFHNFIGNV